MSTAEIIGSATGDIYRYYKNKTYRFLAELRAAKLCRGASKKVCHSRIAVVSRGLLNI
jgi:hypothetical protein